MSIEVKYHKNTVAFRDSITEFLQRNEAENNLILGLVDSLAKDPTHYSDQAPLLLSILENNNTVAAALMTPPYNLVVTQAQPIHSNALIESLIDHNIHIPGILGPKQSSQFFAEAYCQRRDLKQKEKMNERVYQAEKVIHPAYPPGKMRLATKEDFPLLVDWGIGFIRDALLPQHEVEKVSAMTERKIEEKSLFIWENHGPKSMASFQGHTPNGVRVGYVYTPEMHRHFGYGSAITASLTQHLLDKGKKFCFLFTDLSNPTSNSIYKKIGYREVCDFEMIEFVENARILNTSSLPIIE